MNSIKCAQQQLFFLCQLKSRDILVHFHLSNYQKCTDILNYCLVWQHHPEAESQTWLGGLCSSENYWLWPNPCKHNLSLLQFMQGAPECSLCRAHQIVADTSHPDYFIVCPLGSGIDMSRPEIPSEKHVASLNSTVAWVRTKYWMCLSCLWAMCVGQVRVHPCVCVRSVHLKCFQKNFLFLLHSLVVHIIMQVLASASVCD